LLTQLVQIITAEDRGQPSLFASRSDEEVGRTVGGSKQRNKRVEDKTSNDFHLTPIINRLAKGETLPKDGVKNV